MFQYEVTNTAITAPTAGRVVDVKWWYTINNTNVGQTEFSFLIHNNTLVAQFQELIDHWDQLTTHRITFNNPFVDIYIDNNRDLGFQLVDNGTHAPGIVCTIPNNDLIKDFLIAIRDQANM